MEKLKMENKGKLIVLEGACDGVGKSTQLKLLKDELKKALDNNPKLLKLIYNFYKSIEY